MDPEGMVQEIKRLRQGEVVQLTYARPRFAFQRQRQRPMEIVEAIVPSGGLIPPHLEPWYPERMKHIPGSLSRNDRLFLRTMSGEPSYCFVLDPSFFRFYGLEIRKIEHQNEKCNYIGCILCEGKSF